MNAEGHFIRTNLVLCRCGVCNRWFSERWSLRGGHPIDDFWKPLRAKYFWWKILVSC
jgi:hypothetical protein